jgi:hypothetical protein
MRPGETYVSPAWRRRTGIEPARDRIGLSPVLKTGGPTRRPDASMSGRSEGRSHLVPFSRRLDPYPGRTT